MSKFKEYLNETKGELKHVNWPSRQQTIVFTIIVILISVAVAYFLGFFDFVFSLGIEKILRIK
jgi:preprotein translocase subunit SecE